MKTLLAALLLPLASLPAYADIQPCVIAPDGSYAIAPEPYVPCAMISPTPTLTPTIDPGFCGVWPLETGNWDPYHEAACRQHDEQFAKMKAGEANDGILEVTKDFIVNTTQEAALGLYAVAVYVPYVLLGGLGGCMIWGFRSAKKRIEK